MLNLHPIFVDAIHAFSEYDSHLRIPSLPVTVFLMQTDVVNHYRYALTHYLPLTLKEHFLQNSSIGSPYEKWAKFTNEDFEMLSFGITNLIRYTGRLVHETKASGLQAAKKYADSKSCSSIYISPLVEINNFGKQIGICILEQKALTVTPFATEAAYDGSVRMTSVVGGPTERFHVTVDESGKEYQRPITLAEYRQITQTLRPEKWDLQDRSVLEKIVADGLAEIETLTLLNRQFGKLCKAYCSKHDVTNHFDDLNESWLV